MEFTKAIEIAEKYLRDFVLYLVHFFRGKDAEYEQEIAFDDVNRSIFFGIVSAVIGAYFWDLFIVQKTELDGNVWSILAESLIEWFSLGIMLYFIMKVFGIRVNIILPILSVFRVFSVSRLVAVYAAYLINSLLSAFSGIEEYIVVASALPITAAYAVQVLMLWMYFWRETADYIKLESLRIRVRLATFVFLCIATLIAIIPYSEYLANYVFM